MDNSSECMWSENMTRCFSNVTTTASTRSLLEARLGPQNKNVIYVIFLLMIYGLIFISGTVGNICTCLVILKNNSLRTTTNYYLLSLALSDVLILLLGKWDFVGSPRGFMALRRIAIYVQGAGDH